VDFKYVIDANAAEPIMLILTHIGYDEYMGQGVDGSEFLKELLTLDSMGKSRIQIWINSVGGSVIDGWSILGGMLKTKAKVDTYNIGVAASTAGWLFQAGRERIMSDYALWMGHNPSGAGGEVLDRMRNSIITTISQRTGMTQDAVGAMLDKETYMNAEECLENNFCDTIQKTNQLNVKRVSQATSIKDKWSEALQIVNSFLPDNFQNNQKTITMADTTKLSASITNRLGLHEAASEVMAVEAIDAIKNKLTATEVNLTVAENKAKMSAEELAAMREKCDNLQKEVDSYKSMMEAAEAENRKIEATNMVTEFAKLGKIVNDAATIDFYVGIATTGKNKEEQTASFERTKNILNGMPTNKKAETITVVNTTTVTGASAAALRMAQIAREKGQAK
jgi:ATP-dependent protease ClpP protease subunit